MNRLQTGADESQRMSGEQLSGPALYRLGVFRGCCRHDRADRALGYHVHHSARSTAGPKKDHIVIVCGQDTILELDAIQQKYDDLTIELVVEKGFFRHSSHGQP